MATTQKKEEVNPFVLLFVILAFAVAIGGGLGGGDGGDKGGGGSSAAEDPCEGKDADHVVDSWVASNGKRVTLRCGTEDGDPGGYRHIKARHMRGDVNWRDVVRCIGRTVTRGAYRRDFVGKSGRTLRDIYTWDYGGKDPAEVLVKISTGRILTAYAGSPRNWAACAGR